MNSRMVRCRALRFGALRFAAGVLVLAAAGCSQLSPSSTPASTPTSQGQLGQAAPTSPASSASPSSQAPPVTQAPTSTPPSSASVPLTDFTVCVTPVVTCQGELKTQPAQIILSGDGTAFVTDISWTGWGLPGATGAGTLKLDNCDPNCAQGSLSDYATSIVLSDPTAYGNGKQAYAEMNVDAPGSPFGSREYKNLAP